MEEGRVGLEPTRWCLTNTCSAAELPTQSRVPCGNRTRLSSLEGWHLCRSAKGTYSFLKAEAVGLEPTIPILRDTCFLAVFHYRGFSLYPRYRSAASLASSRMTSLRQAAATGIEPVS